MIKVLGSFTGIRIGIATAKGFHDSLDIPLIGISSLESLCYNVDGYNVNEGRFIASVIDCKNENVYFALYRLVNNNYSEIIAPNTNSIYDFFDILNDSSYSNSLITFVGDGAISYKEIIKEKIKGCTFVDEISKNSLNSFSLGRARI